MGKPVIAAVNGYALGGGLELALACDIIYASEKARIGLPEVTLGIIPGFGGTQRLARRIGTGKAKELIFTGKTVTGLEAYELGIVDKVVADDRLMMEVRELAGRLLSVGPIGLRLAKSCVNESLNLDVDSGMKYEAQAFALCCGTGDHKEGMGAFLDKRPAVFQGQ
jgi:enoyl-CoA hydratase